MKKLQMLIPQNRKVNTQVDQQFQPFQIKIVSLWMVEVVNELLFSLSFLEVMKYQESFESFSPQQKVTWIHLFMGMLIQNEWASSILMWDRATAQFKQIRWCIEDLDEATLLNLELITQWFIEILLWVIIHFKKVKLALLMNFTWSQLLH